MLRSEQYALNTENSLTKIDGNCVGRIVGVDNTGMPLVDFSQNSSGPVLARTTVSLDRTGWEQLYRDKRSVVLIFENGNPELPIIMGIIQSALDRVIEQKTLAVLDDKPEEVKLDDRRLIFKAKEEIVLQCGKGSITLRKNGKIVIKGTYLLSRSKNINKIKGGAVEIN